MTLCFCHLATSTVLHTFGFYCVQTATHEEMSVIRCMHICCAFMCVTSCAAHLLAESFVL